MEFINSEEIRYSKDYKRGDYGTDLKCQRQCEEWNSCVGISVSHPASSCFLCKTDILEVAPWGIKDWVFRQPKGNVIENDFKNGRMVLSILNSTLNHRLQLHKILKTFV